LSDETQNMPVKISLIVACCVIGTPATAQERIPEKDRVRLAEAFRIADLYSDRLWTDWNKIPFAVLLVTPEQEFLLRHPKPSDDFAHSGYDSLLRTDVYARPRTFDPGLLATFPAVGGIPTVVVGQAEHTQAGQSSRWVLTLLHEHFHQLQQSQSDYYESVNALGLSRGDQSGMWMLNYAFPYDSDLIRENFALLARELYDALQSPDAGLPDRLNKYLALRTEFKGMLDNDDYLYFTFQLWQEGVSRYTEVKLAEALSLDYEPTLAFQSLPDYRSFADEDRAIRSEVLSDLLSPDLHEERRTAFYAFGAAEALLLDRTSPGWRLAYFPQRFSLESFFPAR
ncbi:MAG TPA: hypothetical protein VGA55_05240, partial [Bacteroidota bacterium]